MNLVTKPYARAFLEFARNKPEVLCVAADLTSSCEIDSFRDQCPERFFPWEWQSKKPFCPYRERVQVCAEAVAAANRKTGKHCLYVPNVTAPAPEIAARVQFAQQVGAGGLLIAPGLTGFDTLRALAEDETVKLPILSHPALLGSMVTSQDSGFSHRVLFRQLQRIAGANASIYPNYGGRFAFTREQCESIAQGCRTPLGDYPPIFPTPGGGMTLEKIPEMLDLYGNEVMFLMGGGLYGRSPDLADNARYFLSLVGR